MPTIDSAEATQILAVLAGSRESMGLEALHTALPAIARRTLQRRLADMVAQGRLSIQGASRARRYAIAGADIQTASTQARDHGEAYIALSPEAAEVRRYVRQPLHLRRPCAYAPGFLEAYQPNHTAYLPESLRIQLHQIGRPDVQHQAPGGTFARDILGRLLIDLSWASSQLEGNTYSRLDTERLIEHGTVAEGKDALETQMILNHKAAIEYLVGDPRVAVDASTVIALHALLSDGLLRDPRAVGRLRMRPVEISGSTFLPVALPQTLLELFGVVVRMAAEIADPFEQAFFLMVHLPYLQPFDDVNKRVSRLAANIPLVQHNLCPLSFIDVPAQAYVDGMLGVYELQRVDLLRDVFVWAYQRSCQQYVALRQQLVPPDTFRLRHRNELAAAVRAIVQGGLSLDDADLVSATPSAIAAQDRPRFMQLVRDEFAGLHEGNAVRFGLRPLELAAWQGRLA